MQNSEDDDFQVTVIVESPEQKTQLGGANKYYVYHVHGQDKYAEFSVYRRYSDFITLKNCMKDRWPGIYLPALPEKKFIGNNHAFFVDTRKRGLQEFLSLIASVKYLWYGDEFQLFMKNNISDVEKSLGNLGKTNNRQISTKYEAIFKEILNQEITEEQQSINQSRVQQFKAYLKNAHMVLQKVAKVSDQMAQARRKFNQRYNHILETFLPDLEDKCIGSLSQNKENLWFINANGNGLTDSIKSFKSFEDRNAFHIANELIKEEIREIQNFNNILKHKEDYEIIKHKALAKVKDFELQETKINAGKQSIMSKIKNKNKEQQLKENQTLLNKAKEELKQAEQICKVIDYVLAGDQIEKFKEVRKVNYYKTLKELAKIQKQTFEVEEQIWTRIASENSPPSETNKYQFYEDKKEEKLMKRSSEPPIQNSLETLKSQKKEQKELEHQEKQEKKENEEIKKEEGKVSEGEKEEEEQNSSKSEQNGSGHEDLNEQQDPSDEVRVGDESKDEAKDEAKDEE